MIPRDTYDGAFYRAVLAIHMDQFQLAQQCIDNARDILDTELTAMAGESYQRAYGVSRWTIFTSHLILPLTSNFMKTSLSSSCTLASMFPLTKGLESVSNHFSSS